MRRGWRGDEALENTVSTRREGGREGDRHAFCQEGLCRIRRGYEAGCI